MKVENVFVVCKRSGLFAGVTRPIYKQERQGKYGLIGGKVEVGESLLDALLREIEEEGWKMQSVETRPFYHIENFNSTTYFFKGYGATMLRDFKEKGKIKQVWLTVEQLTENRNKFLKDF